MSEQFEDLVAYARTRDANYPATTQYVDVALRCPSPLREALLALYSVLHLADDLVDEPQKSSEDRKQQFDAFVSEFSSVVEKGNPPAHPKYSAALTALRELHRTHGIDVFEPYTRMFSHLRVMLDWPARPHFHSRLEVAAYNRKKFTALIDVFFPFVFSQAGEAAPLLHDEFVHLMLAMHVVNVLMDLEEDARAGQFWFPISDCGSNQLPRAEAVQALLRDGTHHLACARFIRDPASVGEGLSTLFTGLAGIYETLADVIARQWKLDLAAAPPARSTQPS